MKKLKEMKDKLNKKKKRFSIQLDVSSHIYDDPSINYYSITVYCDDLSLIPTMYFYENNFETKGDIVVAMVNVVLNEVFKKFKKKGLIKDFGLHTPSPRS